jgi:hypothetical protein
MKGGDSFHVVVGGKETTWPAAVDNGNGMYSVSFTPGLAGDYLVGVTLNQQHICGSRFVLHIVIT